MSTVFSHVKYPQCETTVFEVVAGKRCDAGADAQEKPTNAGLDDTGTGNGQRLKLCLG